MRLAPAVRSLALAGAALSMSCRLSCSGDEPAPTPTTADVTVAFPGTTIATTPVVLYSGVTAAACVKFEPDVALSSVVILVGVSYDPACGVELDVFAPEFGAYARAVDPLVPNDADWLLGAIDAGTLSVSLPDLKAVPLRLWIVATGTGVTTAKAARDRLLDKAYPIYAMLGAGLTFDTLSSVFAPSQITADCGNAGTISTNATIYDATKINVYFVAHYGNTQGLTPAQNCWMQAHPEIIFISWGNSNLTDPTLAHELGHALGLVHPTSLGGHTYTIPGFGPFNLMATNTDVTEATVGQLYAINFSKDSWMNRVGSPDPQSVVRVCQNTWGPVGPCPALTLVAPGWPP